MALQVFIDTSGSTHEGGVLGAEVAVASRLVSAAGFLPSDSETVAWYGWSSTCVRLEHGGLWVAGGTTVPSSIVPFLTGTRPLILSTDGMICAKESDAFAAGLQHAHGDVPNRLVVCMIVVRAQEPLGDLRSKLEVDLSVVHALLARCHHVLVLLVCSGTEDTRVYASKGAFAAEYAALAAEDLHETCPWATLPLFDPAKMALVAPVHVPHGHLLVHTPSGVSVVSIASFAHAEEVDDSVLAWLASTRTALPMIDTHDQGSTLRACLESLHRQARSLQGSNAECIAAEQAAIRGMVEAAASFGCGSQAHRDACEVYKAVRVQHVDAQAAARSDVGRRARLDIVRTALEVINAYLRDKTSLGVALTSNRAARAALVEDCSGDVPLPDLVCAPVFECPIAMDVVDQVRCVFVRSGSLVACDQRAPHPSLSGNLTSDLALEGPFGVGRDFGQQMLLPGLFSRTVCEGIVGGHTTAAVHPFTREHVGGYLPLSDNVDAVVRVMARLVGGRAMQHLVRVYIAAWVAYVMQSWCSDEDKAHILPAIRALCDQYKTTKDLRGAQHGGTAVTARVPLACALAHVTSPGAYRECLGHRDSVDVEAIVDCVHVLLPGADLSARERILAQAHVMHELGVVRARLLKSQGTPGGAKAALAPFAYVQDANGYCQGMAEPTLHNLLCQLFWYCPMARNTCERRALTGLYAYLLGADGGAYGKVVCAYLASGVWDVEGARAAMDLRRGISEPAGDHFPWAVVPPWSCEETVCAFCEQDFYSRARLLAHLQAEQGVDFYPGQRTMMEIWLSRAPHESDDALLARYWQRMTTHFGGFSPAMFSARFALRARAFLDAAKAKVGRCGV